LSTELAVNVESSLSVEMSDLAGLGNGKKFLPYLQLVAKTSKLVDKGFTPGHWVLTQGDKSEDLGTSFDCIFFNLRMKAMHLNNGKPVAINFDRKSSIFGTIIEKSKTAKFGEVDGYMWGCEYVIYIPKAKNGLGCFVSYFASSETAKSESVNINTFLIRPDPADATKTIRVPTKLTVGGKQLNNKYKTWVPTTTPCSAEFSVSPTQEELTETLTSFLNPPQDNREAVKEEETRVR
jgi:hypothetical protein